MTDAQKQALIDRYIAAYNAFDIDGMLAVLAPDVRFENHAGDQMTVAVDGIADFRAVAEMGKKLFSSREQRISRLSFGEDSALADIDFRGQLAADIPDGPAAGTVIALQGQSEFSFADGLISRIVDRS